MTRQEAINKAKTLVSQMTVEEKASQLKFNADAIERLSIPEYNWWNEALHGVARAGTATVFPQAIALAASFDEDLIEEIGECAAEEARAKYNEQSKRADRDIYKGLTMWSPNVNIFRDPRWGRGHETYGEDPYLTSCLGTRYVKGLQGDGEFLKTAACAKHFAVHSGPESERHFFNAIASKKDMEETYLPAFEACVKEGHVEAVMGAYNRTNSEPCCASRQLQHYLRDEWGFEGHFVSDCWAVRDFHEAHKVTSRPEESVKMALEAGCDLNCGCTYEKILNAYHEGLLDESFITRSCIRLFTTRFLLGMFDRTEYDDIPYTVVESEPHIALSHRAAQESFVLLKNNGILPLDASKLKTIGVIGPNADSRFALIGNYHGTSSEYITVLEGIRRVAGDNIRILYSQGCDLWKKNVENLSKEEGGDRLSEAAAVCDYSDLVILVTGLDETLEGEEGDTGNSDASGDKFSLEFPESQMRLIRQVLSCGKPVVMLNMTGSAMDLRLADKKADALVQIWYPGARGGLDVAKMLFGQCAPSGKLPVTFYQSTSDLPDFKDYSMRNRTYRYYAGTPLYPFGYGLTYGKLQLKELTKKAPIDDGLPVIQCGPDHSDAGPDCSDTEPKSKACEDWNVDHLALEAVICNPQDHEISDVLQIYIKDEDYELAVPHPCLCWKSRVTIPAGSAMTIEAKLRRRAFTSVDEDGVRAVRSRHYTIYAGFSQPDPRSEELMEQRCLSLAYRINE